MPTPKNLGDVYYEREQTEWYWRALGTVCASLILLGFLVFPKAFPSPDKDPQTLVPLSIVSVVFLALGYSLSVALWFVCQSWLFQFDVLFIPCLCSCVLGAINVGINVSMPSSSAGMTWSTAPVSALSLALASTTVYAILCVVTNMKIRRARLQGGPGYQSRNVEAKREVDPEDTQRKAWAQLLSPMHSFNRQQNDTTTYRIDIPDKVRLGAKGDPDASRPASTWHSSEYSLDGDTMNASPDTDHSQTPSPNPYLLTPNAAALREARERAMQRSFSSDLRAQHPAPRELASTEARTPNTPPADKALFNQGAVYRPTSEIVYEPSYEMVTVDNYIHSERAESYTPTDEHDMRIRPEHNWV